MKTKQNKMKFNENEWRGAGFKGGRQVYLRDGIYYSGTKCSENTVKDVQEHGDNLMAAMRSL